MLMGDDDLSFAPDLTQLYGHECFRSIGLRRLPSPGEYKFCGRVHLMLGTANHGRDVSIWRLQGDAVVPSNA
jgi:hypothetical protein